MLNRISALIVVLLVSALLIGCAGEPQEMTMKDPGIRPSRDKRIVFPNGLITAGGSSRQAAALAEIMVQSHNMAVQQRERMERSLEQGKQISQRLRDAFERNQSSARMSLESLHEIANDQGSGEITIFFPVDSAEIPEGSPEHERLVRFADYLARAAKGRTVHIISAGSASDFGPDDRNRQLAEKRAQAPIPILNHYLVKTPHQYHRIYGTGDTYSPGDVNMDVHRRYQHVHLTAFYEEDERPAGQSGASNVADSAGSGSDFSRLPQGSRFTNSVGMDFVRLQSGVFTMGSPENEYGRDDNERQHQVALTKDFYIQTTEVTQRQWKAVTGENPSYFQICGSDCPVEQVSWNDVREFIKKLNQMEHTETYRLPTEAEWEYACRAGSRTPFYGGGRIAEDPLGYNQDLALRGWYFRNSEKSPHRVARKEPNAWGLYDMHGNVWEWCRDWVSKYPFHAVSDPAGPGQGLHKIRRGGSWSHYPVFCRSAYRSWIDPDSATPEIGFRLVKDVAEPPRRAQTTQEHQPGRESGPASAARHR
ncbi:MAG: SUMF1/EgtB/PvdO family nonheme iron enzyme [Desulfohalobiaceae bacterium]|nr:SUMF1/EgtB/PvdO family nonheme iron enzyme [Desulfohalobiaceae bacterium]